MQEVNIYIYLPTFRISIQPKSFCRSKALFKKQWHEYEDNPHQDFVSWMLTL